MITITRIEDGKNYNEFAVGSARAILEMSGNPEDYVVGMGKQFYKGEDFLKIAGQLELKEMREALGNELDSNSTNHKYTHKR